MQAIDEKGTRDTTEFINISKDDALSWPEVVHRTYPATVAARMAPVVRPFVEKSWKIDQLLLEIFDEKLKLPRGTLASLHRADEQSGCLARCIRAPPRALDEKLFIPAHTDYGSLVSVLC